ncbi:MAG: 7-cyano-7-deazaguanine synthase, partial [Lachnospiraceae bacterium]|nr:7-cyano-7-deazaguanine synthase [Lachnospiraceae bacterium]
MAKVIIGLSGGVDSAVAAYLLQKEGYDVEGVTLRTWEAQNGVESRCCEIDDAHRVAMKLGIRYHAPNCMDLFKECVTDPFMQGYVEGLTPNPCVVCNRYVKWERMLYEAKVLSADYVATGHYAQIMRLDNGRYTVMTATHAEKDQTYMLWMLTQEELGRTLMPLWPYSKSEVREIAKEIGLSVADKKDSQ